MARWRAYVVVAPGLESIALDELRRLGITGRVGASRGGIGIDLTTRQLYAIHRWSHVPTRVLLRVGGAKVHRFDELEHLVAGTDWSPFLRDDEPVALHVASQASTLYHEGAIAERVLRALGRSADPEGARLHVRIHRDVATLSVDASGASLHHRGWRARGAAAHAAPLRPTIAAAMLLGAGHDGTRPVVDPMTGSGTIAIEAATIAAGVPNDREFAFLRWPSFEPGTWASVTRLPGTTPVAAPVLAADRDAGAIAIATGSIEAAGVTAAVRVEHAALGAQHWPDEPALVVCNPPYGQRLGDREALRDLYTALGRRVRDGGHRLCVLAADDRLARASGLALREAFATSNGGIGVRCWVSHDI